MACQGEGRVGLHVCRVPRVGRGGTEEAIAHILAQSDPRLGAIDRRSSPRIMDLLEHASHRLGHRVSLVLAHAFEKRLVFVSLCSERGASATILDEAATRSLYALGQLMDQSAPPQRSDQPGELRLEGAAGARSGLGTP